MINIFLKHIWFLRMPLGSRHLLTCHYSLSSAIGTAIQGITKPEDSPIIVSQTIRTNGFTLLLMTFPTTNSIPSKINNDMYNSNSHKQIWFWSVKSTLMFISYIWIINVTTISDEMDEMLSIKAWILLKLVCFCAPSYHYWCQWNWRCRWNWQWQYTHVFQASISWRFISSSVFSTFPFLFFVVSFSSFLLWLFLSVSDLRPACMWRKLEPK